MHWNDVFLALYNHCVMRYQNGDRNYLGYYQADDLVFLGQIGCQPREMFDFVEDFGDGGDPTPTTALLVAAVRRDYFTVVQGGVCSDARKLDYGNIPTFGDTLDGIAYLPRILAKARAKLRGELDPDLMFCCGGDRRFLKTHGDIHPADFLRHVWAAGDDDAKVAHYVKTRMPSRS